ncbi:hypothetical protein [Streptomyces chattanoogensis]|uniref:Uncharacterized protein n=1 Tax=Streptomyces chattanoogensis TaxID=66876 RepID=A0A0N0H362_9ACTN|nr:hypothetical protein [Streptomyces chattanoogensis]KPC65972.1 hypothetical protein ADL29_05915 [Streptomyces chattanoogensis]
MSNTSSFTYAQVGAILHDIGMVSEEKLRSVLEEAADYAHDEVDQYEAADALEEFGVAVSVHADSIDSIYSDYAVLLEEASEVAGNKVAITNVRLIAGEGGFDGFMGDRFDTLKFERDGKLVTIGVEHFSDRHYNPGAACRAIAETAADDDPRSWHEIVFEPHDGDTFVVLATPEQKEALRERLGFRYLSDPEFGDPGPE